MTPDSDLLTRLDLLTLRDPARRQALVARFLTLRRVLRDTGFHPELLDSVLVRRDGGSQAAPEVPGAATMLEKLLAMALVYCGFQYERAVEALAEACTMDGGRAAFVASRLRRAMSRDPRHPVMVLVQVLLASNEGPLDLSPERTLTELHHLAMGDLTDVMTWDETGRPAMIPSEALPRAKRGIVSELTHTVARDGTTSVKVKGVDKLKALELLAKHQGLLVERVDVQVDVSIASRLEQARARAQQALIEGTATSLLTHVPESHHEHLHVERVESRPDSQTTTTIDLERE